MKTYLIFLIQAYQQKTDNGTLVDNVLIELIDTTVDRAMARAKKMVKKDFYRLSDVTERPICSSPQA